MRVQYLRRLVIACVCALIAGVSAGDIADILNPAVRRAAIEKEFADSERQCLREAVYYEGRSGLVGEQIMQAMVIMARVADPEYPKTICAVVHQGGQFSYLLDTDALSRPVEPVAWERADTIARHVIRDAWTKQLLPRGAECVRSYKVSDIKLASLKPEHLVQLRVSERSLGYFSRTQVPVFSVGSHTFYRHKNGCKHPLPTT